MQARYRSHWELRARGFSNPQLDRAIQSYAGRSAIRGREQQMIDAHSGVGSPKVGNSIRGVAKANPFGRIYHNASNAAFGNIAPYTGY
jgi:hypothetical protein